MGVLIDQMGSSFRAGCHKPVEMDAPGRGHLNRAISSYLNSESSSLANQHVC